MFKVVLLIPIVYVSFVNCLCDRTALAHVDAIVLQTRAYSYKEKQTNVHFNLLDDYEVVDVIHGNATVLCEGIVKNFPKLRALSLIDANISAVEPMAFQNVPVLESLSLAVNKLTEVKDGDFNYIKSLRVLYLSKNKISKIEIAAFDSMPNLERIYLDRNELTMVDMWFDKSKKLKFIDLSFNQISTISDNAMRKLPADHKLVYRLAHNQISYIPPQLFVDPRPSVTLELDYNELRTLDLNVLENLRNHINALNLNYNKISCLSEDVLREMQVMGYFSLYLYNNPLDCNCEKKLQSMVDRELLERFYFNSSLQCDHRHLFPIEYNV